MADLIPLKAGRNIWGHCDVNDIKQNCRKLIRLNEQVKRMVVSSRWKLLLDLTFCIFSQGNAILSGKSRGKSQGIKKKKIFCGNHELAYALLTELFVVCRGVCPTTDSLL